MTQNAVDQENDASLAMRPRNVRLSMKGYLYIAGVAIVAACLLGLVALVLRGTSSLSNTMNAKFVIFIFGFGWALWSCGSFFWNRIRERQLFTNGELSRGQVFSQSAIRYGSEIIYSYRDASGVSFQKRATDFSEKFYEGMPIHIFYDPLNPSKSAALESSLYRLD